MAEQCPICKYDLEPPGTPADFGSGKKGYTCLNCGNLSLSIETQRDIPQLLNNDPHKEAILSHAIRKMHMQDEWVEVNSETLEHILKNTQES